MKVALCHHYSLTFYGGGERFLIETANQLKRNGCKVAVYALPFERKPRNYEALPKDIEYHEGFLHKIDDADIGYFVYAPLVHKLFIGNFRRVGALHSFVFLTEMQSDRIRSMNSAGFMKQFGFLRFISKTYFDKFGDKDLSRFNAVHVINKEALKFIRRKKVYYIPNWIDTSRFRPLKEKNEKFTVIFSGRRSKGFPTFAKITQLLRNEEIDFISLGSDLPKVKNVKNFGFITDIEKLIKVYSSAHLLVHTSEVDVFPLTLLEAAACQTPIVALPTKAVQGLELPVFYAGSANQFALVICMLRDIWHKKREKFLEMCKRMRLKVVKHYDMNRVFPRFLGMLREVASS